MSGLCISPLARFEIRPSDNGDSFDHGFCFGDFNLLSLFSIVSWSSPPHHCVTETEQIPYPSQPQSTNRVCVESARLLGHCLAGLDCDTTRRVLSIHRPTQNPARLLVHGESRISRSGADIFD